MSISGKNDSCGDRLCHSPACILSLLITAVSRGELRDAWNWSDGPMGDTGRKTECDGQQDKKTQVALIMLNESEDTETEPEGPGAGIR